MTDSTRSSRGASMGDLRLRSPANVAVLDRQDCSTKGRVLVVDEHTLMAVGLQMALTARSWNVQTTSGPTAHDVLVHAQSFEPNCVLLDIHHGGEFGSAIDLIGPLSSIGAQVVMLTVERRRMVLAECIEAGAVGWVGRSASLDEVDAMLGLVGGGGTVIGRADRSALLEHLRLERAGTLRAHATFEQLTRRETLVLGALVDGLTAEEIAEAHFVALTTVRSQIRAVLQKLGVRSQLAAVAVATANHDLLPHQVQDGSERRRTHHRRVRRHEPAVR